MSHMLYATWLHAILSLKNHIPEAKKNRLSHLYWHLVARDPTSVQIVPPSNTSATAFGLLLVKMIDNPLTLGPKLS